MADLSTKLGPFELFSLVILALAMLAGIGDSTPARGLLWELGGTHCDAWNASGIR